MAEVHGEIFAWRQARKKGWVKGEDPIEPVADEIAKGAWLLCFDEFTVTDIADAMILGRLFKSLFARGVVVVATSNVEPSHLYQEGLNRSLFLPSIALIETKMAVLKLDSRTDFRLEKMAGSATFHVPADAGAEAALTGTFRCLTGATRAGPPACGARPAPIDMPPVARQRGPLLLRRPLRGAARRAGLSRGRAALPHGADRRHPRRCGPRRPTRPSGSSSSSTRSTRRTSSCSPRPRRAARALRGDGGARGVRVRPHGVAPASRCSRRTTWPCRTGAAAR